MSVPAITPDIVGWRPRLCRTVCVAGHKARVPRSVEGGAVMSNVKQLRPPVDSKEALPFTIAMAEWANAKAALARKEGNSKR
jgi:hypothetical protein